jgi:hypothetical protein
VKDYEIDDLLAKAARPLRKADPALLDRIAHSIRSTLRPVRPLPPSWLLISEVVLICMGVAVAGASATGLAGIEDMSSPQRLLTFSILLVLAMISARELIADVAPGSRHAVTPSALLSVSCAALLAAFSLL